MTDKIQINEEVVNELKNKKDTFTLNSASGDGEIQIAASAIAMMIRKEVLAVENVIRFAPVGLLQGAADFISGRNYERAIGIEFNNGKIDISLILILQYGCNIRKVVSEVQNRVKSALLNYADATANTVNVLVSELEEYSPEENENSTEEPASEAQAGEQ